jgi:hypothetical protein
VGSIRWREIRVGAPLFAVAIALIVYFPHDWAIIILSLIAALLVSVALASNFARWRHPVMDSEHAKRMQIIARSLDAVIRSNSIILTFNDGQGDAAINDVCFRADFPALDPLLREWVESPQVIGHKAQEAKVMIEATARSQWPAFAPVALGRYAFDYSKNNLTNLTPPTPAITLAPSPKPSQLLQGTTGGGTVLHTYPTGLTGPALVEAQKDESLVRQWIADMFISPEVESWRAARLRQTELQKTLSDGLQQISVKTFLPRGGCTVCQSA